MMKIICIKSKKTHLKKKDIRLLNKKNKYGRFPKCTKKTAF